MEKLKIKADKRDKRKKPKMKVSGKSVFKLQEIIINKTNRHSPAGKGEIKS